MVGPHDEETWEEGALDALFKEDGLDDPWVKTSTELETYEYTSEDEEIVATIEKITVNKYGYEGLNSLSALERQMAAYPILADPDAQFDLLAIYKEGLKAQETLTTEKRLTFEHKYDLDRTVSAGKQAQTALIGSMFKLVLQIAREQATKRYGRQRGLVVLEDLVSEANAALVKALDTYNPKFCPTWSLYAGKTIRDTVRNRLSETTELSHISVPSSWWRLQRIAIPIQAELAEEYGREPTTEEMQKALTVRGMEWAKDHLTAQQLTLDEDTQRKLCHEKLVKQGMDAAIRNYEKIKQLTGPATSLNATFGDDSDKTKEDKLSYEDDDTLFDSAERIEANKDILAALAGFSEREREIIMYRFGFMDDEDWHYTKLAPKFGVSPERIRQIEQKIIDKLQSPEFTYLKAHLDPDAVDEPGFVSRNSSPVTNPKGKPAKPRGPPK